MSEFVPAGYIDVDAALLGCMMAWFEADFSGVAAKLDTMHPAWRDGKEMPVPVERVISPLLDPLKDRAEQRLRRLLFSGHIAAHYFHAISGEKVTIDAQKWASTEMDGVIKSGWYYPWGRPKGLWQPVYRERVLVLAEDLAELLPKEASEAESVNSGDVGGRPSAMKQGCTAQQAEVIDIGSGDVQHPTRKRGPARERREHVKSLMRGKDPNVLSAMKEVEMETEFKASRDTCRKARDEVLSEFVDVDRRRRTSRGDQ